MIEGRDLNIRSISVIVPLYNEEDNVDYFCDAIFSVLEKLDIEHEVVVVDDGSDDQSLARLRLQAAQRANLKIISFRRNFGQTAALMAGIDHAKMQVIVPIDADLQNDPKDIPRLLDKLAEGYGVVSGWRKDRKDAKGRSSLSEIANFLISKISGVSLHDYGCSLKAYRSDIIRNVRLYGEMHRFIPIYAQWVGARVTEIPVAHHPRRFGRSKYGFERIFKVLLDLAVVQFLHRSLTKPIYVFGGVGFIFLILAAMAGVWALILKFGYGVSFILTPLPLVTVMGIMLAAVSVLMGFLAEIMVRTYYETQGKRTYIIGELINIPDNSLSGQS